MDAGVKYAAVLKATRKDASFEDKNYDSKKDWDNEDHRKRKD